MLKVRCSESDWRGVDYARKYAIAPFAILRRTDSRIDLLGRICVLGSTRNRCLESQAVTS